MTEHIQPVRRTRNTIARAAAFAGAAIAVVALSAPSAMASGTSPKLNGCYSTWGSTGSVAHCVSVTRGGQYKNRGVCTFGNEDSLWKFFQGGESNPKWGGVECTFDIEKSFIMYTD
ncbi:hypothetical protein [Streptomyces acidiscabies]|uniref:Uncharacterized protein n=1 Tax=Streptomyces acidiscabies TaxID=42234 RepID=A0AAP6BCZ8_9ACTN|nr:hypothetical protein [Streptomyces acidiscabies]MBP5938358.1 hypothetical protein [Streptomyces sp. LBUM 1476]MBZ3909452.1 hypothetical protein [Streptomyces acidiscabies]MDX2962380.1 hypothetical protein [Streptomyces acidiscabies]MDX3019832.1 hypothetical protein [Streptomyces acidiscabies]MDX3792399.1 hypothetical protein [Streptomyces acidiscabies]